MAVRYQPAQTVNNVNHYPTFTRINATTHRVIYTDISPIPLLEINKSYIQTQLHGEPG